MTTQLFISLSQATRVTDAVDVRGAAGGGMLNVSSADRASDVETASTATYDELARYARPRNSPFHGKAVSHGVHRNVAVSCCRIHGHSTHVMATPIM